MNQASYWGVSMEHVNFSRKGVWQVNCCGYYGVVSYVFIVQPDWIGKGSSSSECGRFGPAYVLCCTCAVRTASTEHRELEQPL